MEDFRYVAGSNLELWNPVLTELSTAAGLCDVLVKSTFVLFVLLCVIVLGSTTLLVGCTSYLGVLLSVSYKKKIIITQQKQESILHG